MFRRSLTWLFTISLLLGCGSGGEQKQVESEVKQLRGVMFQGVQNPTMPCDWVKMFDGVERPALAFLWKSYGDADSCLTDFIHSHSHPVLHIYASNGVCKRRGNCGDKEAQSWGEIIQNGLDIAAWAYYVCPHCEVHIVVQLEDNFVEPEACHIAGKIRDGLNLLHLPVPQLWRNPNHAVTFSSTSSCFDGIELHNTEAEDPDLQLAKRCAYSNDGQDLQLGFPVMQDAPVITREHVLAESSRLARCDVYFWHSSGNCITQDTSKEPFPADRLCMPLDTGVLEALSDLIQ